VTTRRLVRAGRQGRVHGRGRGDRRHHGRGQPEHLPLQGRLQGLRAGVGGQERPPAQLRRGGPQPRLRRGPPHFSVLKFFCLFCSAHTPRTGPTDIRPNWVWPSKVLGFCSVFQCASRVNLCVRLATFQFGLVRKDIHMLAEKIVEPPQLFLSPGLKHIGVTARDLQQVFRGIGRLEISFRMVKPNQAVRPAVRN